jgi:hypothetical protein
MSITHAGLRAWAKGLYPLEAAVELLVRTSDGRFANPGYPWIQPCDQPGWWWLDHQAITDDTLCALSGGEQRILRIVASLAGGTPVNLYADLPGLDRDRMSLVLAAMAHANGSHEHADIHIDHDRGGVAVLNGRLPSLHSWPEPVEGEPHAHRSVPPRPEPATRPAADPRGTTRGDRTAAPRRGLDR